ncbi:MAG: hypothetical protein ACTHMH_01550 [Curtobacterium sp.]
MTVQYRPATTDTAPAEVRHGVRVFTAAEMASIFARTPPREGTREERRARLHRALNSVQGDVRPARVEHFRRVAV